MPIRFSPGPYVCCTKPTPPPPCCGGNPPSKAQVTFNGYDDYPSPSLGGTCDQVNTSGCAALNGAFLCTGNGGCGFAGPSVSFQLLGPDGNPIQTVIVQPTVAISEFFIGGAKKYRVSAGWSPIDSAYLSDLLDPFDCPTWSGSLAGSTPGGGCRPCASGPLPTCPDDRIPDPHLSDGTGPPLACPVSCQVQFFP